jgi:hypothetical protein
VPALAAGVAGLFGFPRAGAAAAAAAAAFFWIPMAWVLYDALGGAGAAGVGIEVAAGAVFAGAPFAALDRVLRRRILAALAAVAAVGLLAARLVSPSSADAPQAVNLSFRADGDAGTARWLVRPESGRLPRELRALGLAAAPVVVAPWSGRAKGFAASADGSPALPPPKLDVLEDRREGERRTIRARVRSPRGASEVFFAVAPQTALERFAIEGRVLPPPRPADLAARGGWRYFVCATVPPSGIEVELVANGGIELHYGDVSSGLPPEGARLLRARPPDAAPVGSGDATVVARRAPF